MNVNQGLSMSNNTSTPSIYYILTTCETSTPNIDNKSNVHSILMNNQRKVSSSSSKYGFQKKCRDGYSKYYQIFIDSLESDGVMGCQTSKEAENVKSLGYTLKIL